MIAALIGSMLDDRLGRGAVVMESAGFGPPDIPAISDAVDAMRRRGLDVSAHRSRQATGEIVRSVDLILTAERDHVIRIASLDPAAFRRSMTLPEFITAASRSFPVDGDPVSSWVSQLTAARTAQGYLREPIEEVDDPTGSAARAFEAAVVAIEAQCSTAATMLARVIDRSIP